MKKAIPTTVQKTSNTAYCISCGLAKLASRQRWKGYFSDEMIKLNRAFMIYCRDTVFKTVFRLLPSSLYTAITDRIFVVGMTYHYLFRKLYIESQFARAELDGVRQVVVLGAGLDTLAIRMARKHGAVQFFEIDLPATQQAKLNVLEKINHPVPSNCSFIKADLARVSLEEALHSRQKFSPGIPSLVILEGVLMYLEENEVKLLFKAMHKLFKNDLVVVFGAMVSPDQLAGFQVRVMDSVLKRNGEATLWHCPSGNMPQFMASLGYKLTDSISYKELQSLYRSEAEIRNVPLEDENYYVVRKIPASAINDQL